MIDFGVEVKVSSSEPHDEGDPGDNIHNEVRRCYDLLTRIISFQLLYGYIPSLGNCLKQQVLKNVGDKPGNFNGKDDPYQGYGNFCPLIVSSKPSGNISCV